MATTNDSLSDDDILPETQVFQHRYKDIKKDQNLAFNEMCKTFNSGGTAGPSATTVQESTSEFVARVEKTLPKSKRARKGNKQEIKAAKPHSDDDEEYSEDDVDGFDAELSPKRRKSATLSSRSIFEFPEIKFPKAGCKRLRDLERQEARRMQAEIERIMLSDDDVSPANMPKKDESILDSKQITLKVRRILDVKRITVLSDEKFSSISAEIGRIFDLKMSKMMLCRNGCDRINVGDTPLSLKLGVDDIIDIFPYAQEDQTCDADYVRIQLQSWDEDRVEIFSRKCGKLIETMKRWAGQRNIPLKDLIFEFDGEKINGSETPEDLDMEDGSLVDVKPKKSVHRYYFSKSIAEFSNDDNASNNDTSNSD